MLYSLARAAKSSPSAQTRQQAVAEDLGGGPGGVGRGGCHHGLPQLHQLGVGGQGLAGFIHLTHLGFGYDDQRCAHELGPDVELLDLFFAYALCEVPTILGLGHPLEGTCLLETRYSPHPLGGLIQHVTDPGFDLGIVGNHGGVLGCGLDDEELFDERHERVLLYRWPSLPGRSAARPVPSASGGTPGAP